MGNIMTISSGLPRPSFLAPGKNVHKKKKSNNLFPAALGKQKVIGYQAVAYYQAPTSVSGRERMWQSKGVPHSKEDGWAQGIQPEQELFVQDLCSLCKIWQAWLRKNYVKDIQLT